MTDTDTTAEFSLNEFRSFTVRCVDGKLGAWRNWLLQKFLSERDGVLRRQLQDRDLTPTFGAIIAALSVVKDLGALEDAMISDQGFKGSFYRNLPRTYRLDWQWNLRPELNPERQLVSELRRRFKGKQFLIFMLCLTQTLSEQDVGLSEAVAFVSDFCELVYVLRSLGQLESFKLWLENYRGVRPVRPEVWTAALRDSVKSLESPEGRATLQALAEHYADNPMDSEALFGDRRRLLRQLRLTERTGECLFDDPSEPDHMFIWWTAFAHSLPSSVPSKFCRRVRDLSELRRLVGVTRDLRQRLFWAKCVLESGAES